jgi:hypothetical protein
MSSILHGGSESTNPKKQKYPYLPAGPLRALLHDWDGAKNKVSSILDCSDAERVKAMWEEFLRNARGRECWICGESIHNKLRLMRKHIEAKYWPDEKVVEAVEKKDAPQERLEEIVIPPVVPEKTREPHLDNTVEIV